MDARGPVFKSWTSSLTIGCEKIQDSIACVAPIVQYFSFLSVPEMRERKGCSSEVEHLTADQEVSGLNPDAPCLLSMCRRLPFALSYDSKIESVFEIQT